MILKSIAKIMNKRAFIFLIVITILSGCTPSAANLKDQAIETVGEDSIKTSVDATLEAMREDATATPISDKGERGAPPPPPIGSTPSPESSPPNETGETCNPKKYMGVFGLDERVTFTGEQEGSSTDIYVMDANSWEKLPNTSGGDTEPKWSRDGSRIAYVSDGGASMGDIFVMGADGHNRVKIANTLYYEDSPVWSPDGEKIAFTSDRDGNWDIFVMEADGSDQTNITNSPSNEYSPTWSPDGSRIAFSSDLDGFDIYVINANGSNLANITNSPEGEFDPSWSPDAGKIAFSSDRDGTLNIHIMHSDGSNNTNLTYNSGSGQSQEPEWSPDGSRIVFSDTGPCGHSAIWVMDSDGENIYLLWEFPNGDSYSPHWEPEESTAIAADVSNLMTIIGRVVWNNQPVSTAKIVAGIGGSPETATNVTTSPVDSEGYFSITYDGAEEHTIWVLTPDDEYLVPERAASLKEMREQITTVAGTLDLEIIGLEKKIQLITPDNGASTTTTPTFTWEAIPSAVNYYVIIDALDVAVSIEQYEVGNVTEFELAEPLPPDIKYTWYVTAFSDSGWAIASNTGQFFKVVSSDNVTTDIPDVSSSQGDLPDIPDVTSIQDDADCDETKPTQFVASGFTFQGEDETFFKVDDDGNPLGSTCGILGSYQRFPVLNDWHTGVLSYAESETSENLAYYLWTNSAGASWPLYPEFHNSRFNTDSQNPYYDYPPGESHPYFTIFAGHPDISEGDNRKRPIDFFTTIIQTGDLTIGTLGETYELEGWVVEYGCCGIDDEVTAKVIWGDSGQAVPVALNSDGLVLRNIQASHVYESSGEYNGKVMAFSKGRLIAEATFEAVIRAAS